MVLHARNALIIYRRGPYCSGSTERAPRHNDVATVATSTTKPAACTRALSQTPVMPP
jgi:hypothetical protein